MALSLECQELVLSFLASPDPNHARVWKNQPSVAIRKLHALLRETSNIILSRVRSGQLSDCRVTKWHFRRRPYWETSGGAALKYRWDLCRLINFQWEVGPSDTVLFLWIEMRTQGLWRAGRHSDFRSWFYCVRPCAILVGDAGEWAEIIRMAAWRQNLVSFLGFSEIKWHMWECHLVLSQHFPML